ncbi:hypothetical protein B0J12DRAFT_737782 [Macrophomina phaseolina]|uniref:FAD-binding domain-containing protein n=1 Tax=Macrophomina phaseolina TaxID=35725 RepID=A0ABQ8GI31_9PEZI|nr:hypothetical protein B0J12DRAFT_737782 [Macrophomina phaseolina]
MVSENHVSVAIIGGGVARLTLANIPEQSGISFILWKAHDRISPPAGASVGLMPNGMRILDQIGIHDALEEYIVPHDFWEHRDADGSFAVGREIEAATPGMKQPADYKGRLRLRHLHLGPPAPARPKLHDLPTDASLVLFVGMNGTIFWFTMEDLKKTIPYGQTPRYSDADIDAAFAKVASARIAADVTFADVFSKRCAAVMTALQEGVAARWFAGRMALMGDAAHKMVRHAAMGANQAMESAACFANRLFELRAKLDGGDGAASGDLPPLIAPDMVQQCLEEYTERRRARVTEIVQAAGASCGAQLKKGDAAREYIDALPRLGNEVLLEKSLDSLLKAEKIDGWAEDSDHVHHYSLPTQRGGGTALANL